MGQTIDIPVRFIIDPKDIDQLQKLAEEDLETFRARFTKVNDDNGSTFRRFINDQQKLISETADVFDARFNPKSSAGKLFSKLIELPNLSVGPRGVSLSVSVNPKQAFDIQSLSAQTLGDFIDNIFNNSAIANDLPRPQPSRPSIPSANELDQFIRDSNERRILEPGEQILNADEILETIRRQLQNDLNNFASSEGLEVPELKIKIAEVKTDIPQNDSGNLFDTTNITNSIDSASKLEIATLGDLQLKISNLKEQYEQARETLLAQKSASEGLSQQVEQTKINTVGLIEQGVNPLKENLKETTKQTKQAEKTLDNYGGITTDVTKKTQSLDKEVVNQTKNLDVYSTSIEQTDAAAQNLGENGLQKVAENAEKANIALSDVDLSNLLQKFTPEELAKSLGITIEELKKLAEQLGIDFEKAGDQAKSSLDSLGVFAANIAGNIADTFSDLLFNVFKGNFDSIGNLWKGLLDTMLRTFTDFAAGVLVNPIRVSLEGFLRGSGGGDGKGGGGGLGIFSGIGDLFKKDGSLGFIGDLFREGGALASIGGLFAEVGSKKSEDIPKNEEFEEEFRLAA